MYKKEKKSIMKHMDFAIIDMLALSVGYILACLLRVGFSVPAFWMNMFIRLGFVLVLIYVCLALVRDAYKNILRRDRWQELWAAFVQVGTTFMVFIIYVYITQQTYVFSRAIYFLAAFLGLCSVYICRIIRKRFVRVQLMNHQKMSSMLIIADEKTAIECIQSLRSRQYNVFYASGIVITNEDRKGDKIEGCPVVCNLLDVRKYVLTAVVDEVFLSMPDNIIKRDLVEYFLAAGITVHINLVDSTYDLPNRIVEKMGCHTVLTASNSMTTEGPLVIKRLMDIAGGLAGLLLCGLIYLFVAPQIRRQDPGPVFFAQERIGKNGRRFKLYKFRSMYLDAEARKKELMAQNEMQGLMFKMDNDPRILPGIGNKIRDWSLDEFPQFWNVLKGDMSLVGTRPPTVDEFLEYDAHHKMRLSFKPGITGMWQVSGRSNITDFEEIVRLDNEYIKNWTIGLDISIIMRTVLTVLHKEGAK